MSRACLKNKSTITKIFPISFILIVFLFSLNFLFNNQQKILAAEETISGVYWSFTTKANTAPVFANINDVAVTEGEAVNITVKATDADGDDLTFSIDSQTAGGALGNPKLCADPITSCSQPYNWATQAGDAGAYTVTFGVTDGHIAMPVLYQVNIQVNLPAPKLSVNPWCYNPGDGECDPPDGIKTYNFGPVIVNDEKSLQIELKNTGAADLTIVSLDIQNDNDNVFSINILGNKFLAGVPITLSQGTLESINLIFKPTAEKVNPPYTALLVLETDELPTLSFNLTGAGKEWQLDTGAFATYRVEAGVEIGEGFGSELGKDWEASVYSNVLNVLQDAGKFDNFVNAILADYEEVATCDDLENLFGAADEIGVIHKVLNNKVYYCAGNLTIDKIIVFENGAAGEAANGTIIVGGDLIIKRDIFYEKPVNLSSFKQFASAGWIVKGNVIIENEVLADNSDNLFVKCNFDSATPPYTLLNDLDGDGNNDGWCERYPLIEEETIYIEVVDEEGNSAFIPEVVRRIRRPKGIPVGDFLLAPYHLAGAFIVKGDFKTGAAHIPLEIQGSVATGVGFIREREAWDIYEQRIRTKGGDVYSRGKIGP